MTQQNAPKCPNCGGTKRHCTHHFHWKTIRHRAPAAPQYGFDCLEWVPCMNATTAELSMKPSSSSPAETTGITSVTSASEPSAPKEPSHSDAAPPKGEAAHLSGEVERLREQVRELRRALQEIIEEEDLSLRVKPAIGYCLSKGASKRARAALESTTPQEER